MTTLGLSDAVTTLPSDEKIDDDDEDDDNVEEDDDDDDDDDDVCCCFFSSTLILLYLVCKAAWSAGLVLRFRLSATMAAPLGAVETLEPVIVA